MLVPLLEHGQLLLQLLRLGSSIATCAALTARRRRLRRRGGGGGGCCWLHRLRHRLRVVVAHLLHLLLEQPRHLHQLELALLRRRQLAQRLLLRVARLVALGLHRPAPLLGRLARRSSALVRLARPLLPAARGGRVALLLEHVRPRLSRVCQLTHHLLVLNGLLELALQVLLLLAGCQLGAAALVGSQVELGTKSRLSPKCCLLVHAGRCQLRRLLRILLVQLVDLAHELGQRLGAGWLVRLCRRLQRLARARVAHATLRPRCLLWRRRPRRSSALVCGAPLVTRRHSAHRRRLVLVILHIVDGRRSGQYSAAASASRASHAAARGLRHDGKVLVSLPALLLGQLGRLNDRQHLLLVLVQLLLLICVPRRRGWRILGRKGRLAAVRLLRETPHAEPPLCSINAAQV